MSNPIILNPSVNLTEVRAECAAHPQFEEQIKAQAGRVCSCCLRKYVPISCFKLELCEGCQSDYMRS